MKHAAILLSFYILCLAVAPAVKVLQNQFSEQKKICSTKGAKNHSEHHDKQHCSTFICFHKVIFISLPNKIISLFSPEIIVRHHFSHENTVLMLYPIEIWQPPKITLFPRSSFLHPAEY